MAKKKKVSKQQAKTAKVQQQNIRSSWLVSPLMMLGSIVLLTFPWMINIRVFPFIAPNEEPKWALLIACGVALGVFAGYQLWKKREVVCLQLNLPGILLLVFYAFLAVGIFVGPNITEGLVRFTFWLSALAVWLAVAAAVRHHEKFINGFVWLVSVGSFVFSLRYWWSYIIDYGKPGYNVHVLFSPIGHVNFTGDVLVVLLPALIWMLMNYQNTVLRVLNWLSVLTVMTILLLASSRGALGGVFFTTLLITILVIKHRALWLPLGGFMKSHMVPLVLVASSLLGSVVTYEMLPFHYRDLTRVSGALQDSGEFKLDTLTPDVVQPPFADLWIKLNPILGARTPMYASSLAMAMDAPILGQGTGNFFTVYPGYSNHFPDFRDPLSSSKTFTTNPHNFVLQIATQNGFIATVIFIGLLGYFVLSLFITAWKRWDSWLVVGSGAILGALFDAMFNHVFFNPASMFVFAMLGGAWWGVLRLRQTRVTSIDDCDTNAASSIEKNALLKINIPANTTKIMGASLLVASLLLAIVPVRWVMSEWYAGWGMAYMRQADMAEIQNKKAYELNANNFRAIFGVAQAAYQKRDFKKCIEYLIHFEDVYPYNPPALNMLGAAYLSSGQIQPAIDAFKRAVKILPDFDMAKQNLARAEAILRQQQTLQAKPPQAAMPIARPQEIN